MAADRAKTTLMIALIIFVMLSFILAVTTYLGFQQRFKEQQSAQAARGDMEKANRERDAALEGLRLVRDVIGTDKDTAEAIQSERNELFATRFAGFDKGDKKFRALVDWLDDELKKKDVLLAAEAEKVKQANDRATAAENERTRFENEAKATKQACQDEIEKISKDFAARRTEHEQTQKDMSVKLSDSEADSRQTQAIIVELGKLGPLLSPELRRKFESKAPAGQAEPWPERVRLVFLELKNLQRTITQLNTTLAKLGVADPEIQELVRDSMPQDSRIDGFDGRVVSVNALDRTVLFSSDSTAGMRPGLVLSAYDPADPRPVIGARKGKVEVVDVEGPSLARARIIDENRAVPILAGDGLASSLWAPDAEQEIVIVGHVRFESGGGQDAKALAALAERHGARVVDAVTPRTAMVVDGGLPRATEGQPGRDRDWKQSDETLRKNALARAKELGIRVVPLDGLLDMLGLDREMLDGRRLPSAIGAAP